MEREYPSVRTGEGRLVRNTVRWRILSMLVDKWILESVDILLAFFTVYLFS